MTKVKKGKEGWCAIAATVYLLLYIVCLHFESTFFYSIILLALSPFVIIGSAVYILKHGKHNGEELGDREYGYCNKKNEDLGIM